MFLKRLKGLRRILAAAGFLFCVAAIAGILYTAGAVRDTRITPFPDVRSSYRASDAVLLDRNGEVIHTLRIDDKGRRLEWTGLADVSPSFLKAIVFVEDRRFKNHNGVDPRAIVSAFIKSITSGKLRGASTISMQTASIVGEGLKPRTARRSIPQKWRQIITALALERSWKKEEILEAYINLISYRGELQGIRAASKGLFGKEPSGLTDVESFVLASLITSPNASRDRVARRARQLSQSAGMDISFDDLDRKVRDALSSPYHIALDAALAPHVARMVLREGSRKETTTLDGRIQRFVLEALGGMLVQLRDRHVSDGAAIVVENATGEILAYAGNSGRTSSASWIDGIRARRQAGSTLKPFLYELAIEKGYLTASSILEDTPLSVMTPTGLYVPQNYDNQFRGTVSVRTSLASSLNVPAVKTLLSAGLVPFVERLKEIGFTSINKEPEFYGYSIALGSADVELYELVNAYRVLALGGRKSDMKLTFSRSVNHPVRIMDARAVFIVSQILSDRESRAATFGLENPLATRFWTAVKTGTSKDMRDNWCIGFSERYTVGVWVGNFSGEPMRDVSGVSGAAPVWIEIMNYLHGRVPSKAPKRPSGVVTAKVRFENDFEPSREEYFLEGTEPVVTVRAGSVHVRPRIVYPLDETFITIDPDIPEALQRVPMRFEPEKKSMRWVLNDADTGIGTPLFLWKPKRGRHILSIIDTEGKTVDTVSFTVR